MKFEILQKSKKSGARLGVIKTAHGELHTPAFFPVATKAIVKTLTCQDIKEIGFEGILSNTYHLHLQPGEKIIKKMGGLHKFMNWDGVVATDSGGFQVFSLGAGIEHNTGKIANRDAKQSDRSKLHHEKSFVKITEEGVYFKSHLDGSKQFLSPESSIKIQQDLGADIIFAFDQPSSPLDNLEKTKEAMERTHRWAERCLHIARITKNKSLITDGKPAFSASGGYGVAKPASALRQTQGYGVAKQGLFGIIQGGKYEKLRIQSAKFIGEMDFDGFGIGGSFGSSYGDSKKNMLSVLNITIPLLPQEKPRHLLGIGHLNDLIPAIKAGIDLFDCVYPTRMARHNVAITSLGNIDINKTIFSQDKKPLDAKCQCPTCASYTRAYLCHLFKAKETTGQKLLTYHNLWFFKNFVDNIREKIANGKL